MPSIPVLSAIAAAEARIAAVVALFPVAARIQQQANGAWAVWVGERGGAQHRIVRGAPSIDAAEAAAIAHLLDA